MNTSSIMIGRRCLGSAEVLLVRQIVEQIGRLRAPTKYTEPKARDFVGRGAANAMGGRTQLAWVLKLNVVCCDEACNEYFGASLGKQQV